MKIAILTILSALFLVCVGPIKAEAQPQNCPSDWHPPPCGDPGPTVKDRKKEVLKQAEDYHWNAAAIMGIVVASTCAGKVGGPPWLDTARGTACKMATFVGALAAVFQQIDQRLIEEINGGRDGTQEVVMLPPGMAASFSVDMGTDGDPDYEALVDRGNDIETIGGWIVDSIRTTRDCDAGAMYD